MVSTFMTCIQHNIWSSSHRDQTRKRNKRHPNWKGGSKTVFICRWHDSVPRKPYRLQQKLLDLITEFGKRVGYKLNTQKLKAFLYASNEISEIKSGKNPIWYSNKKHKVPRNKPNERGERLVFRKLYYSEERN